jgi:hypothetical protein
MQTTVHRTVESETYNAGFFQQQTLMWIIVRGVHKLQNRRAFPEPADTLLQSSGYRRKGGVQYPSHILLRRRLKNIYSFRNKIINNFLFRTRDNQVSLVRAAGLLASIYF